MMLFGRVGSITFYAASAFSKVSLLKPTIYYSFISLYLSPCEFTFGSCCVESRFSQFNHFGHFSGSAILLAGVGEIAINFLVFHFLVFLIIF